MVTSEDTLNSTLLDNAKNIVFECHKMAVQQQQPLITRMEILLSLLFVAVLVACPARTTAFSPLPGIGNRVTPSSATAVTSRSFPPLVVLSLSSVSPTTSTSVVYDFLSKLHDSGFPFRTIVVGHGVILESTQLLGPTLKMNTSPKTGDLICTMASDDQSFEFHIKVAQVDSIQLVERELPGKTLRIIRMTRIDDDDDDDDDDAKPTSMCSLILADYSDEAAAWFHNLMETYGTDFAV